MNALRHVRAKREHSINFVVRLPERNELLTMAVRKNKVDPDKMFLGLIGQTETVNEEDSGGKTTDQPAEDKTEGKGTKSSNEKENKAGRPQKKETYIQRAFYITEKQNEKIGIMAARNKNLDKSTIVRIALNEYFEKHK